ncbi:MAG TPA: hypothetical protein VHY21_02620 [Pseudonocardiaceae bacterium]|nr:hypothetical protein [Pseudonocardiaceae bacterium]
MSEIAVRSPAALHDLEVIRAAMERAADTDARVEVRMRPYRLANRELRIRDVTTRVIPAVEIPAYGWGQWLADGGVVYVGMAAVAGTAVAFVVKFALALITALSLVVQPQWPWHPPWHWWRS